MYGAGDVRVENLPDPTLQAPTDAIVRTVRSCICGSDLHPYRSMPEGEACPMGHELIGVVEETGPEVTGVRPGDFVVVPFAFADNTCAICRDGFHTACPNGGWYGTPAVGGLQAQFARIPQASGSLVKVPDVSGGNPPRCSSTDSLRRGCDRVLHGASRRPAAAPRSQGWGARRPR